LGANARNFPELEPIISQIKNFYLQNIPGYGKIPLTSETKSEFAAQLIEEMETTSGKRFASLLGFDRDKKYERLFYALIGPTEKVQFGENNYLSSPPVQNFYPRTVVPSSPYSPTTT